MTLPLLRRLPVRARTALLSGALLSSGLLLPRTGATGLGADVPHVPLVVLVALFVLSGLLVVDADLRREGHGSTLAEVPLVVGLFLAEPFELLLARLAGGLLALLFLPRQPLLKVALNVGLWVAETTLLLAVVGILGRPQPLVPLSWLGVLAGIAAATLLSELVVRTVLRWHDGEGPLVAVPARQASIAAAGTCLGLLAVVAAQVHLAGLTALGILALLVLHGFRAFLRLERRHQDLELLHDVTVTMSSASRPDQVVEALLLQARRLLRARVADLVVLRPDSGSDLRVTLLGDLPARLEQVAARQRAALEALDTAGSTHQPRGGSSAAHAHLEALGCADGLVVSARLRDGDRLLLTVGDRTGEVSTFSEQDRRLFEVLAGHAAAALDERRLVDQLRAEAESREHRTLHDSLTGLPNRLRLRDLSAPVLAAADAAGGRLAVVHLDLDGFRHVNETLGRDTGDAVLREVGRRLVQGTRSGDLVARLGADEFAVVLRVAPSSQPAVEVTAAVRRLRDRLEQSVELAGLQLDIRLSAGVAVFPQHGTDLDDLLQHADSAAREAKRSSSRIAVHDPDRAAPAAWSLQLAGDLRRGLDEGELLVHYQPTADLRTGRITAAEALVRWQHPVHGRLGPDVFLRVAEQSGLVTPLTYEVLRIALDDAASWARAGHVLDLAVNVAVRSLSEPDFPARVLALLASSGTAPDRLVLEVSEAALMAEADRAESALSRLAAAGVRLSVDDVGTGWTSLAHLQRLPLGELKIDGSFVREAVADPAARAVVQSGLDLAHGAGLRAVAESMENQLTWDLLLEMGCDAGQGYLLSPPLPPLDLLAWLVQRDARPTYSATTSRSPALTSGSVAGAVSTTVSNCSSGP